MKRAGYFILFFGICLILNSCGKGDQISEDNVFIDYEFTDPRDGKIYNIIELGDQAWMDRNLDFAPIIGISSYYNNDTTLADEYGRLYSWEAAIDAVPSGWHLATLDEWNELVQFVGGADIAAGKLKINPTLFWNEPNTGATNEYGFNAKGSGTITELGASGYLETTSFWSATQSESSPDQALCFTMFFDSQAILIEQHYKYARFSVRCIKD
ncbi:MAG: hypothetical protein ACI86P_002183 [Flavobacteriales bacterium]|jgi:uncharacterized protein (TIGR02145 family)